MVFQVVLVCAVQTGHFLGSASLSMVMDPIFKLLYLASVILPVSYIKCNSGPAKTGIAHSKFRMLHARCRASSLRAREKRRKISVLAYTHVSH